MSQRQRRHFRPVTDRSYSCSEGIITQSPRHRHQPDLHHRHLSHVCLNNHQQQKAAATTATADINKINSNQATTPMPTATGATTVSIGMLTPQEQPHFVGLVIAVAAPLLLLLPLRLRLLLLLPLPLLLIVTSLGSAVA